MISGTPGLEGKTQRISTKDPMRIVEAELTALPVSCCALHREHLVDMPPLVVRADGATNATAVGSSVTAVETPTGDSRGLTRGEKAMARLFAAVALASMAGGCDARQQMRAGEVRQSGDFPCFSIEDSSRLLMEQIRIAAVVVSETDVDEQVAMTTWTGDFTAGSPPYLLSTDTCIPYGVTGDSIRTIGEIIPVQAGKRYSVFINADIRRDEGWQNRRYQGDFCVFLDEARRVVIHDVKWDPRAGRRDWSACAAGGAD